MVFKKGNQLAKLRKKIIGFKKGNTFGKINIGKKRPDVSKRMRENNPMFNDKYIKKNKISRKGFKHTEKTKRKISESEKGKIISKETRKKMSKSRLGKKNPKHSKRMKGNKNPAWNNGSSFKPYTSQFNRDLKKLIKKRDKFKCILCKTKKSLCVHHVNYIKEDCRPENLVTLCLSCNSKVNTKRKYWEIYFNGKNKI